MPPEEAEEPRAAESAPEEEAVAASAEDPLEEEPFAQPDGPMGQFRTVYSEEEASPDDSGEGAQLTMGEPGFHLNLEEVADDEPEPIPVSSVAGEDGVPSFEGFFRKK